MTIAEMTEVMNAFEEGKKIQSRPLSARDMDLPWADILYPTWDFASNEYRVKPETRGRRPYINTTEMIDDFKKRFNVKDWPNHAMPLIWIRNPTTDVTGLVFAFRPYHVITYAGIEALSELYKNYTYLDGSPCGVLEEEDEQH